MRSHSHGRILFIALLGLIAAFGPVVAAERREPTRSYGAVSVILYETSWCPYCTKAREQLKEMGVTLTEYDIEKEPGRREEMMAKSSGARGVPLIDVEGIILRGYSAGAITAAVEKQRRK